MCYHKTSFACLNCALIFYCNMLQNCCWWSSILIFNYVIKKKYEIGLTHILPMCNGQNLWRSNPHNWICLSYQKTTFQYINSAKQPYIAKKFKIIVCDLVYVSRIDLIYLTRFFFFKTYVIFQTLMPFAQQDVQCQVLMWFYQH